MRLFLKSICAVALLAASSACDQQDERKARASALFDGVVEQLEASERPGGLTPSALQKASVEDRAFGGVAPGITLITESADRKRFAVGSIIAKPRTNNQQTRSLRATPSEPDIETGEEDEGIQAAPPPDIFGAPSPSVLEQPPRTSRIMEAMITAQSSAFQEMDKLGLEGSITTSESGQMVIDLFAAPTQLTPDRTEQPFIAEDVTSDCPENFDQAAMQENKALATNCMIEILRASGNFEYVEKDFIFDHQFARRPREDASIFVTPDDPLWYLQWHFQNNGVEEGQSPGGASFVDFWTRQGVTGSDAVNVAVIDTGLAMSHPDIASSPNIAPGWDMVTDPAMGNDGDGRDSDPNDPGDLCNPNNPNARDSFHGTHVAGTLGAAASNNGSGVAGGAWAVTIVPVRALGKCGGRLSDINDAIRWAGGIMPVRDASGELVYNENPADIINLSIGLAEACPASMQDAINGVVERGAIVVAAAGNARISTERYAPGGCENIISVAAGDARGHIAPYSNFGPEVDVLASGGDLDRDDNQDGFPDGVLSTRPAENCLDPLTGEQVASCYYAYEQGTSMAAPHVSAALALIAARSPDLAGPELEARLLSALTPRADAQCEASCATYPDATPIAGRPDVCLRSCGGLLDLQNLEMMTD